MNERVVAAARELGLDVSMTTLERPTRTVDEAARAVGCDPGRIAKSVVFVADGEPVVAVASGAHKVDTEALCRVLDCAVVDPASPKVVRAATGFAPGGVPPFSHGLQVVMDSALMRYPTVWAAGGDGNTVFEVDPRVLAERTGATVADIGASEG
ncbi:MAG: YbaK/EbsC family protein [Thermoleophilaceae bacterium]|nr:YbaK/EbsC family protein [Thermoleophilaceae bacterium]